MEKLAYCMFAVGGMHGPCFEVVWKQTKFVCQ